MKRSDLTSEKKPTRWFAFGCLVEGTLGVVSLAAALILQIPLWSQVSWSPGAFGWGMGAVLPLLLVFAWMFQARHGWLREIRFFLERTVRPIMQDWSIGQLFAISLLAGVGEELLFRGVLQETLRCLGGPWPAVLGTSVLFGIAHWVTRGYAAVAAVISIYLGALFLWTGNLLVPLITHAVYDFVALFYFLRLARVPETGEP